MVNRASTVYAGGPNGPRVPRGSAFSHHTHAPALTPDPALSTKCRFIIGHKLRRKNLGGTRYAGSSRFRVLLGVRLLAKSPPSGYSLLDDTRNLAPSLPFRSLPISACLSLREITRKSHWKKVSRLCDGCNFHFSYFIFDACLFVISLSPGPNEIRQKKTHGVQLC